MKLSLLVREFAFGSWLSLLRSRSVYKTELGACTIEVSEVVANQNARGHSYVFGSNLPNFLHTAPGKFEESFFL
jgi:hypothetical protein